MPPARRFAAPAFAAACTLLAAAAAAFGPTEARLVSVRAGLDGLSPPERWSPLTVTVQPGDKAQSLEIVVQYRQDATQVCALSAPVATTPGQQTTVPLLVCLPQDVGRIDVTLKRDGLPIDSAVFARSPSNREMPTPFQTQSGGITVGYLDVRLRPDVLNVWVRETDTTNYRMTSASRAALTKVRADDLTQTWAGLDALNCLVARQSSLDKLPVATLDAVATWVSCGGRLILVTDSPGPSWKRFTPADVSVGDITSTAPPMALQVEGLLAAKPADHVNARPILLGQAAKSLGWKGSQAFDNGSWMVCGGPYGGGFTTLVGADPTLLTAALDDAALVPFWKALLQQATPDVGILPNDERYDWASSGDGAAAEAALRSAVDSVCDVPPVPKAVYALVVLIAAALAIAVSIGDFFILGKLNARKRSWLTAAAWTTLCAAAAWVLPNLARSRETSLGRVAVIDAFPAIDGRTPSVWRTGVTTLFAASSGNLELRPSGQATPSAEATGYWRGVSVVANTSRVQEQRGVLIGDLPLRQHISAIDGSAAAVTPPADGLPVRQWTLRTLLDQAPIAGAPAIKAVSGGDGTVFEISGLPQGAELAAAAVQSSRGWSTLTQEPVGPGGKLRLKADAAAAAWLEPWRARPAPPVTNPNRYDYTSQNATLAPPGSFLELDGARRRTAAFDAIASTGDYAVVHLMVQGPSDITTSTSHRTRAMTVYRIAVPLPSQPPQPPSLPADQP